MSEKRLKVLFISDHPLIPSGVGNQAKLLIEGLLRTERFKFICLGGAIKHPDYRPQQVAPDEFGEGNWMIIPVDGHGNKDVLRQILHFEKPDAVIMFTDPRFFYWIWEMEDEVRSVCPLLYWHVWDNDPHPDFNRVLYDSTDFISALSLKTYGLLRGVKYDEEKFNYIPHAIHEQLFKPLPEEETQDFRNKHYGPHAEREFVVMWNNRNARRKNTGDVIESFARAAEKIGKDKCALFMHTAPKDPEGQDIIALASKYKVDSNLIISDERVEPSVLNRYYNAADVTINIAQNEGFGLGTLESLFSGTPIIVNFTGGLQFQIGDWWKDLTPDQFADQEFMTKEARRKWNKKSCGWWGVPVFPSARSCVGSQTVPYIYDDRVDNEDVVNGLVSLYKLGRSGRKELGMKARAWAVENFNYSKMISSWAETIEKQVDKFHSNPRRASITEI